MSYYSRRGYLSTNTDVDLWMIVICIALIFAIIIGVNACTAQDWNDGSCPKCGTRYELRGASRGLKYYACPECGFEVERYGW